MNPVTNTPLLLIGTGAVASAVATISTNLVTGIVLFIVGAAIFELRRYMNVN